MDQPRSALQAVKRDPDVKPFIKLEKIKSEHDTKIDLSSIPVAFPAEAKNELAGKFSPGGPPKTRLYPGRRGYITNVSKRGFSVSALYHRKSNKLHITARAKSGYDDSALTSWDSTSLELELFRKLRSARVPFAVEPIEAHGFIKRGFVNFNSTNTVNPVKFGIKPARFIVPVRPIKDPGALPVPGAADNRGHGEQEPLSLQPTAGLQVDSDMACPTKTDPAQNPSTDQSEFGESIALDMSSPALVVPTAEHNVGQH